MSGKPQDASDSVAWIVSRLERLPSSGWQVRTRVVVGLATFFDAFDALTIAYVLPVIAPAWKLSPAQIGLLISAGFVGQLIGALVGGVLAERYGRKPVIVVSVLWFGVFSFACALANGLPSLLVLRLLQGLGLGAEVPTAATYVSELAKSGNRGRFVLFFELAFPIGLVMSGVVGAWIVPHYGWRWLFVLGGIPAVLAAFLSRSTLESPRWLAANGRIEAAERTLAAIEERVRASSGRPLPEAVHVAVAPAIGRATLSDLFGPLYRRRTYVVWVCWFATYFVNFGLVTWLPTVYQKVFSLPLSTSLNYALVTSAVGFGGSCACALLIDRVGRRKWFSLSFALAAAGLLALWFVGPDTPGKVLLLATVAYIGIASLSLGLYLYTAELYPTRARSIGVGAGTAWLRIASIVAPFLVGSLVAKGGLGEVFLIFGLVSVVAAVVTVSLATETAGLLLEEVSP